MDAAALLTRGISFDWVDPGSTQPAQVDGPPLPSLEKGHQVRSQRPGGIAGKKFRQAVAVNTFRRGKVHSHMHDLQTPFRFFGELVVGSALLLMARSLKEVGLLAAAFLVGLVALETCLRMNGL